MRNKRRYRDAFTVHSYWQSYSDMMAALLLVFVLILCVSLWQYFTMLETKTAELDQQKLLITDQQLDLKITGKQIGQSAANVITETGFDDAALKVCGGFQYHTFIVDINGFAVVKPCGHGCGGHIAAKHIQNTGPNFG